MTTQPIQPALPGRVLISQEEIAARLSSMGAELSADYAGEELLAAVILRGSFMFAADLIRRIDPGIAIRLDFMSVSSYGNDKASAGKVRIVKDLEASLQAAHVLIIEDILDTGRTIERIKRLAKERGAASIRVATLIEKQKPRTVPVVADYVGFRIPDVFVVGFGLDHAGLFRNLPDIRVLEP